MRRGIFNGFAVGTAAGLALGRAYKEAALESDLAAAAEMNPKESTVDLSPEQQSQREIAREAMKQAPAEDQQAGLEAVNKGYAGLQKRYTLGDTTQDRPFSKDEVAAARSDAIAQAYRANGKPQEALAFEGKAGQLKLQALQLQNAQMETDERKGKAEAKKELDAIMADPAKYIQWRYSNNIGDYGQGEHAGMSVDYKKVPGGVIAWQVGPDGQKVGDDRFHTEKEMRAEAFRAYQMKTDPAGAYLNARHEEERSQDVTYRNERAAAADKHTAVQEKLAQGQLGIAGANLALAQAAGKRAQADQDYQTSERERITKLREASIQLSGELEDAMASGDRKNVDAVISKAARIDPALATQLHGAAYGTAKETEKDDGLGGTTTAKERRPGRFQGGATLGAAAQQKPSYTFEGGTIRPIRP